MPPDPRRDDVRASLLSGTFTHRFPQAFETEAPFLRADEYPGTPTSDRGCKETSLPDVCDAGTGDRSCHDTSAGDCDADTGNPSCKTTSERGCLANTGNRTCQTTSDADCRSARGFPPEFTAGWSAPPPLG